MPPSHINSTPPLLHAQGIMADIALSVNSTRTIERMVAAKADFWGLLGDFSYANVSF